MTPSQIRYRIKKNLRRITLTARYGAWRACDSCLVELKHADDGVSKVGPVGEIISQPVCYPLTRPHVGWPAQDQASLSWMNRTYMTCTLYAESFVRFIEGQAFLLSYDSAPRPPPTLSSVGKLYQRYIGEKERQLADGRGGKAVGVEPNETTARKPGLL